MLPDEISVKKRKLRRRSFLQTILSRNLSQTKTKAHQEKILKTIFQKKPSQQNILKREPHLAESSISTFRPLRRYVGYPKDPAMSLSPATDVLPLTCTTHSHTKSTTALTRPDPLSLPHPALRSRLMPELSSTRCWVGFRLRRTRNRKRRRTFLGSSTTPPSPPPASRCVSMHCPSFTFCGNMYIHVALPTTHFLS